MRKYKKIKTTKLIEDKGLCNKCGKKIELSPEEIMNIDANLFHFFKIHFGYGSDFDREVWDFDLCEECLVGFIKEFRIPPNKRNEYIGACAS